MTTRTKRKPARRKAKGKPKPRARPKAKGRTAARARPKPVSAAAAMTAAAARAAPVAGMLGGAALGGLAGFPSAPVNPGPMPPGVELLPSFPWTNYGTNLQTQVGTMYRLSNGPTNMSDVGLNAARWAVQHLAFSGGSGIASGSRWSFSEVALSSSAMFDLRFMAKQLQFVAADLANPAEAASLARVQAGTMVTQLITYLENAGRDLIAMGGNCGQTVAGAVATGTHGGFTSKPGFPDMVRALHVIAEDGREHWIERGTKPVYSAAKKAALQAQGVVVHDTDAFFNHAVVSLGAFGLTFSVTLDTAPAYSVSVNRLPVPFDDALDKATFDRDFGGAPPLDFATVVNPFAMSVQNGRWRGAGGAAVRQRIDLAPPGTVPTPGGSDPHPINDANLAPMLAVAVGLVPALVRPLIGPLMTTMYGPRVAQGPMSCAYPLSLTHSPTLGMELGVPGPLARGVFGRILAYLQAAPQSLPGVIAIRQTTKSAATLSLAQWDPTTTFEFACLKVAGTEELLTGLLVELDQQAVPFTVHLGQLHGRLPNGQPWLTQARFRQMFGDQQVDAWIAARQQINPKGNVFSTPLTKGWGLTS